MHNSRTLGSDDIINIRMLAGVVKLLCAFVFHCLGGVVFFFNLTFIRRFLLHEACSVTFILKLIEEELSLFKPRQSPLEHTLVESLKVLGTQPLFCPRILTLASLSPFAEVLGVPILLCLPLVPPPVGTPLHFLCLYNLCNLDSVFVALSSSNYLCIL